MLRIGIIGPESSGKSELSKALAKSYSCDWIPEYAREYLENLNRPYSFEDLEEIARKTFDLIQSCENSNSFCFIDTELIVMKVWSEFKYKKCSDFIIDHILKQKIDFYLLCFPDIPWEYDPLRENENDRMELFNIYENELKTYDFPYFVVRGDLNNRIKSCQDILNN
ncbi:MAG: AAA family ATPase [Flavobacteriia bacterium]|jgi:nicotinamide riboside kinase